MAHRYELRSHGADGAHPDDGAATFPTTSPARMVSGAGHDDPGNVHNTLHTPNNNHMYQHMVSSTVPLARAGRRGSMLRPGTAGPTTRIFTGTVRASPNRADGDMTLNPLGIVHSGSKLGPRPRRKATPPSEPAEGEDDRPPPPPSPTAERLFESDVADKLAFFEHKFIDMQEQIDSLRTENLTLRKLAAGGHSDSGFFSSAEIATMMTDLNPSDTPDFLGLFAARMFHKNALAYEILNMADEEWLVAARDPAYAGADSMTARALMACLKPDKPYVKRFLVKIAKDPSMMTSGRSLFVAIANTPIFSVCEEEYDFMATFEKTAYFKAGAPIIDITLAADQLEKDFSLLPEGTRGAKHALLFKLLEKMEMIPSLQAEAKSLRTDIWKADTMGTPVYTSDQLIALIAMHISKASPTLEASVGDGRRQPHPDSKCVVCGKKGCNFLVCKAKCPRCGFNFCKGARGEACDVQSECPPCDPKNAIGRLLPAHLAERLTKANADFNKKKEASAGEFNGYTSDGTGTAVFPGRREANSADFSDEEPSDDDIPFPGRITSSASYTTERVANAGERVVCTGCSDDDSEASA